MYSSDERQSRLFRSITSWQRGLGRHSCVLAKVDIRHALI